MQIARLSASRSLPRYLRMVHSLLLRWFLWPSKAAVAAWISSLKTNLQSPPTAEAKSQRQTIKQLADPSDLNQKADLPLRMS